MYCIYNSIYVLLNRQCHKIVVMLSILILLSSAGDWKDVPESWRSLYTWSSICKAVLQLHKLHALCMQQLHCSAPGRHQQQTGLETVPSVVREATLCLGSDCTHESDGITCCKQSYCSAAQFSQPLNKTGVNTEINIAASVPMSHADHPWDLDLECSSSAECDMSLECLTKLAAAALHTLDMGLLMGSPIKDSPLTSCATILNPIARLNQPFHVRCPDGVNNSSNNLKTCIISEDSKNASFPEDKQNMHTKSHLFATSMENLKQLHSVSEVEINHESGEITYSTCKCSLEEQLKTPNWIPFKDIHYRDLNAFLASLSDQEALDCVMECSNCKPHLLQDLADDASFPEKLEQLIQDSSKCRCRKYIPPDNYHSNESLNASIFDSSHPSMRGNSVTFRSALDFSQLVTRPLQVERFLSEDDFLHSYVYRDRPVIMLGIMDDWPG